MYRLKNYKFNTPLGLVSLPLKVFALVRKKRLEVRNGLHNNQKKG